MRDQGLGIGERIRALRLERGLSQAQLAGEALTPGYVSLIESGGRVPSNSALSHLAQSLGVDVEFLRSGRTSAGDATMDLEIRDLEISVTVGSLEGVDARIAALHAAELDPQLMTRVRVLEAQLAERLGKLDRAIEILDRLLADRADFELSDLRVAIMLSRCHREMGDLARACEVGERVLKRYEAVGIEGTDAEVQLLSTIAFAYIERGDLGFARMLLDRALASADARGSFKARGAALWNLSHVAKESGDLALAREMADRALLFFAESDDARNIARLRNHLAVLLIEGEDGDYARAESLLREARKELQIHGTRVDVAYCDTEIARVHLARGEASVALNRARSALEATADGSLEAARALMVSARAWRDLGDTGAAVVAMQTASEHLDAMGARRQAARGWVQLAELCEELGDMTGALQSHKRAAEIVGLSRALLDIGEGRQ